MSPSPGPKVTPADAVFVESYLVSTALKSLIELDAMVTKLCTSEALPSKLIDGLQPAWLILAVGLMNMADERVVERGIPNRARVSMRDRHFNGKKG